MDNEITLTAPRPGFRHLPGFLDRAAQQALLEAVRAAVRAAPLYVPIMPKTGKPMSVRMTNCGVLGWVTDKERGYRYQATHPATGAPWPPIPALLLELWRDMAGFPHPPEACLVNFYAADARMGLHQDRDEKEFGAPVVSVSLGDDCLFRVGGTRRGDPTASLRLRSGDVVVLGGESRLAFHGVDRIYPGTSMLLKGEGRINLTLRRVTAAG
jgi:alkylated DNA repair protein (DNA oxidative demethylase)